MNLKRVLTPGWLLGIIAVIAFAVACFMLLAPWQLGKNDSLNARNDRLIEASESDPVPVDEALDAEDPASFEWHFVSATGRFDSDPRHQILVRLRPVDGNQVYQVLIPFETTDGRTLLINRGWVPVGAAGAIGDIPPAPNGEVSITARFRQSEPQPAEPTEIRGVDTVKTFNVSEISALPELADVDLAPQYLQLNSGQPGALGAIPTPAIESGPYLSYGLQWIAFGILAPAALIYFVTSELRNRRNRPLLSRPGQDSSANTEPEPSSVDQKSAGQRAHEDGNDALAARYGGERVRAEQRRARRNRSRI